MTYKQHELFPKWLDQIVEEAIDDVITQIDSENIRLYEAGIRKGWREAIAVLNLHGLIKEK